MVFSLPRYQIGTKAASVHFAVAPASPIQTLVLPLAILRLTIMSEEMPMAERLIAGQKYVKLGGNGDVKKFLHQLEKQCEHNGV